MKALTNGDRLERSGRVPRCWSSIPDSVCDARDPDPRTGAMPQHPTAPRPTPNRAGPQAAAAPDAPDLTVNKVLAGAGAAATSAVLGSAFGAAGTVAGAALGSVASTVATTVYQRSLDHTRDRLTARIRPTGRRSADVAGAPTDVTVPIPRIAPGNGTDRTRARPPRAPRRRWGRWIGATALVFALGLLAVTGVEWAKGSTLTARESGTSVGRVLSSGGGGGDREDAVPNTAPSSTPEPSSTAEPTATPEPTTDPDAEQTSTSPEPSAEPGAEPFGTDGAPGGRGGSNSGSPDGPESGPRPTPPTSNAPGPRS